MAAGLIPAIAALGSAIDAGRIYIVKSQLQAGVDAAALAGARAFGVDNATPQSRTSQVSSYFYGNFPSGYMGTQNLVLTPTFAVANNVNTTTVTATAVLPFSFMRVFGFEQQAIRATAKAELQPRPLEVMTILDNTGSMRFALSGGKTRMVALKEAAISFIDILQQGADRRRDLAVGFIPYDVTVNVGRLLQGRRPGAVTAVDGFNGGNIYAGGDWPTNAYAWKGCVMNDATIRDVSADRLVSEAGAWDLDRTLPGEGTHPAVQPYFVPPMYLPTRQSSGATAAVRADPSSDYYTPYVWSEPGNNLYRLDSSIYGNTGADYLAGTTLYRQYLYDYYIGLNNGGANSGDDVIRGPNGSYYNPTGGNRNSGSSVWYVDWTRLPRRTDASIWRAPADATVNRFGGRTDSGIEVDPTPMPSPNWQCPEEAMLPVYNTTRQTYVDYINNKNGAVYPANGTIHHSGLLWGYRLLVRDDVFTRSNPTNEQPRRAIVFMTDGLNDVDESPGGRGYTDRTFTWYGRWSDGSLSANLANTEPQMLTRFAKVCANIQREANAPKVYIIALVANSTEVNTAFDQCAPGRVYRTSSTEGLRAAFNDVAAELVDLHLVQ